MTFFIHFIKEIDINFHIILFYLSILLVNSSRVCVLGHETKAMLNNRSPRYKRSKLERRINRDVIYCVILLLFLCLFCAIGKFPTASKLQYVIRFTDQ